MEAFGTRVAFAHTPGVECTLACPWRVSVLGAPKRTEAWVSQTLLWEGEGQFPRRRLDLLVLTDLSRFCGTGNTPQLAGAEWPCTWVFCHHFQCDGGMGLQCLAL